MAAEKTVSLALGAGGARGFAHIGVIREIQARGYTISSVAGTSMGALVGGAFAAGKLDEFADWATGLNQRDVIMLLDPKRSSPGAIAADKLFRTIQEVIGDHNIEDLAIPYTAIATDIIDQREVWFQEGDLLTAMRASISIPGVFTPIAVNGRILVDGGLMNPVPVELTARSHSSTSIAISLHGKRALPDRGDDKDPGAWRQWLTNTIGDLRDRTQDDAHPEPSDTTPSAAAIADSAVAASGDSGVDTGAPLVSASVSASGAVPDTTSGVDAGADLGTDATAPSTATKSQAIDQEFVNTLKISDITALSTDAAQRLVARFRLAAYPPDVTVTVPVDACRTLEFYRAQEMIDLGRSLAVATFDEAKL